MGCRKPKIILGAAGDGLDGKNCMMISLHKDFNDYYRFVSEFRGKWSSHMRDTESFPCSLKGYEDQAVFFQIPRNNMSGNY